MSGIFVFYELSVLALVSSTVLAQTPPRVNTEDIVRICKGLETDQCIVREFKHTWEASLIRGKLVYKNYCVLCHGEEGAGNGRAANLHTPPPSDLRRISSSPGDVARIIRLGGAAVQRGFGMPPWGEQLSDEQMTDLLSFLPTLHKRKISMGGGG